MKKTLLAFCRTHASVRQNLLSWHDETEKAEWSKPNEVIKQFPFADIIDSKRVVFNIKGNHFRLVADIEYHYKKVFIVWIGTHADYDKINVKTIRYVKTH